MTVPEKAVAWAKKIAADDSHGYDQNARWGPDYDCSSLVISAYKHAGLPLTSTYTGNMKQDFLTHGFKDVTSLVNLSTGAGLLIGDVLLQERYHTALYIGDGKLLHAAGNENGGATGGRAGDQTGREICIANYFNYNPGGWDCVLRYEQQEKPQPDPEPDEPLDGEVYTVRPGDTLWRIAETHLGNPWRYPEIMKANGMTSDLIHPGDVLVIPSGKKPETKLVTITAEVEPPTWELLRIMAEGNHMTIGQVIDMLLEDSR